LRKVIPCFHETIHADQKVQGLGNAIGKDDIVQIEELDGGVGGNGGRDGGSVRVASQVHALQEGVVGKGVGTDRAVGILREGKVNFFQERQGTNKGGNAGIFKGGASKEEVPQKGHLRNPRISGIACFRDELEVSKQVNDFEGRSKVLYFRSKDTVHAIVGEFEALHLVVGITRNTIPGAIVGICHPLTAREPTKEVVVQSSLFGRLVGDRVGGVKERRERKVRHVRLIRLGRRQGILQKAQGLRLVGISVVKLIAIQQDGLQQDLNVRNGDGGNGRCLSG